MTLAVSTMPDNAAERARWLDEQLVGDRLGELVAELAAANGTDGPARSLKDLLSDQRSSVLNSGTNALSADQLRQLLRQPQFLFDLQELVLTEGGPYWTRLPRPGSLRGRVQQQFPQALVNRSTIVPLTIARERRQPSAWIVSLVTAAAVLLAVFGGQQLLKQPPANQVVAAVGWGWAKPDGLPKSPDAKAYFNDLANGGEEWFKKVPGDSIALAKRINEFRQGCSVLQLADHPALNDDQKTWLKERCRKWAGKFDESLAKLESGTPVDVVRAEADATVNALVTALRGEAAKL